MHTSSLISKSHVFALTPEGEGRIMVEDREVCLPFVLPMERVLVSASKKGKRTTYHLEELLSQSSLRVDPVCSHFTSCGGCSLQHMNIDLYKEFKKSIVTNALTLHGLDPFVCLDPLWFPMKKRRRANLDGIKKESGMVLGFHKWRRHSLVDVHECFILHPKLFNVLAPLREIFERILLPFQKVKVFLLNTDTGMDIGLEIQGCRELSNIQRIELCHVLKSLDIARAFFRHRGHRDILCHNEDPKMTFGGIHVDVDAYSFVQACSPMDDFLAEFVKNWLDSPQKIMDLFCGLGTLALPLSHLAQVEAFEWDIDATQRLSRTQKVNVHKRDLFQDPVTDFSGIDAVVINPPRAGALEQVRALVPSNVPHIAYLSCNPMTMARDLAELVREGGYHLKRIQPIDQFFGSFHIECLAVLEKF